MSDNVRARAGMLSWAAIGLLCIGYAPMAVEFTGRFFLDSSPQLWDHAFSGALGEQVAYGAGSIHHEQHAVYAANRWILLAHTSAGGVAILLGILQFTPKVRSRLSRHRWIGRVYVGLVVLGKLGAMTYLVRVGPERTFDGPAFYLQLWALAIGTLSGALLGVSAIRGGQLSMHQPLMAYTFALLLTAPMLRVLYVLLGLAWPDSTQELTNLAGGAVLAVAAPFGAILASRYFATDHRRRPDLRPLPGPGLDAGVGLLAVASLVALGAAHVATFGAVDRVTSVGVVVLVLALAVAGLQRRAALRSGALVAAEEWRVHRLALHLSLPAYGLLWAAYSLFFTAQESFFGAELTAPALTLSLGFLLVVWRRRVARPSAATAQVPTAMSRTI